MSRDFRSKNPEAGTISFRLAQLRADTGLTQKQFAAKIGIPYTRYRDAENGTTDPHWEILCAIAQKLSVSAYWLLTGIHVEDPTWTIGERESLYHTLTDEELLKILRERLARSRQKG